MPGSHHETVPGPCSKRLSGRSHSDHAGTGGACTCRLATFTWPAGTAAADPAVVWPRRTSSGEGRHGRIMQITEMAVSVQQVK